MSVAPEKDWRLEYGYEEPKECGFCEKRTRINETRHGCGRHMSKRPPGGPCSGPAMLVWLRESKQYTVNYRGTCRYFTRKEQ